MADYSVALGVRPPQIDISGALALSSQMQRDRAAQEHAAQSLQMDRERLQMARDQAALQRQVTQSSLADAQGRRNALAEYVKAQQAGDPDALSKLAAYPEQQASVLQVRNQMDEANRAKFDQSLMRNARRAQYVMGLQGDAKVQGWQASLKEAVDAGDITPQQYQQYSQMPPNDLLLHNVISQATPIQQIYAQNEPTPTQRELKAAGIEPGTPEYKATITGGKLLPKFEKVGNRLFRIDPVSGNATDVTSGGVASLEEPPKNYRWATDNTGRPLLDQTGRPVAEPIPGGPATIIPGEQAGRVSLMQAAKRDLEQAKEFFANMGAGGYAGKVFNAGEAGKAERTVRSAIEATLRTLTGAAATQDEVDRMEEIFAPTIYDSAKTRQDKLRRLEAFISDAETAITQGRSSAVPAASQAPGASTTPAQSSNDPLGILGP